MQSRISWQINAIRRLLLVAVISLSGLAHADCNRLLLSVIRSQPVRVIDSYFLLKAKLVDPSSSLRAYFTYKPRAQKMASRLAIDEKDYAHLSGSAQYLAFTAKVGKELNAQSLLPLDLLKTQTTDERVLAEIEAVERRAGQRNLAVVWQEQEAEISSAGVNRIAVNLDEYFGRSPIAQILLTIERELDHAVEVRLASRDQSQTNFVESNLEPIIQDQIRVRLLERRYRRQLQELGLPFPNFMVSKLSRMLWKLEDKGAAPVEMYVAVRSLYKERIKKALRSEWERLTSEADEHADRPIQP